MCGWCLFAAIVVVIKWESLLWMVSFALDGVFGC